MLSCHLIQFEFWNSLTRSYWLIAHCHKSRNENVIWSRDLVHVSLNCLSLASIDKPSCTVFCMYFVVTRSALLMMDQLLVCTRPVLRSETSSMFVLLQACGATVCARVELSVDIFTFICFILLFLVFICRRSQDVWLFFYC